MTDSVASTARPATAAIAWATARDLFVEIPSRSGPPYIARYARTAEGLAQALNVLIDHAEAPSRGRVTATPSAHPAIKRSASRGTKDYSPADAEEILAKLGVK
jgi:hypothetical protein